MTRFAIWLGCAFLVVPLLRTSQSFAAEPAADPNQSIALNDGEPGQLRGRVVRASTGEPVADADVRLITRSPDSYTLPLVPKRVRSDKDGEFTFEGLDPGTYLVYAFLGNETSREKKYGFEKVVIDAQRKQTKQVELQLKPGVTLRVRVTSQVTGKSLPTATLNFQWTDADDNFHANAQGEIVVPALTPEQWHLEIAAPGHACDIRDVRLVGPETVIAVGLASGGEVTGRVVDDKGEPLPGAKLCAQVENQLMYTLDKTTANEKGEFRLQYLPLGTPLRLGISHAGFERFDTSFSVASQTPLDRGTVQLTPLPDGGTIQGLVVDSAGKPIAGAILENHGTSGIDQNTTHTDANGRFHIERLYVFILGRVLLMVHAKGFAPRQIDITDNDRQGTEPLKIVLEPGHRIRGRVVNHADEPIAACHVYFAKGIRANLLDGQGQTDSEGRFEFDSLPPHCPFAFYAPSYSKLEETTLPLDQDDEVIIRLEPIGLIRGEVSDAVSGKPISNFNVRIAFPSQRQPDNKRLHITSTRMNPGEDFVVADGKFELQHLTNGSFCDVIVQTKGYHRARLANVQVVPETGAVAVSVRLQPVKSGDLIKVGGRIAGPDGSPAIGVQVRLVGSDKEAGIPRNGKLYTPPEDDGGWSSDPGIWYDEFRTAVTNANGEFMFTEVPQGLALQLIYWSAKVPVTRFDILDQMSLEDLGQLRLKHEKPVTLRVTINRETYPDATSLSLNGTNVENFRHREIVLKEGQTQVEVSGLEAGIFYLMLMGRSEPEDPISGSFKTKSIASNNIAAKAGDTIEVDFGNPQ